MELLSIILIAVAIILLGAQTPKPVGLVALALAVIALLVTVGVRFGVHR